MHEECISDIHCTEFFTLTAVDTGVRDVCEPDQMEHEAWGQLSRGNEPGFFG